MSPFKSYYYSKPVLDEFMQKPTITTVLFYIRIYFKACYIHDKDNLLFEITNFHQNIAIIISTKCVTDPKCTFNTDSLGRKHPFDFNLLSSACSYDANIWHDMSLHIIPVNTLLAALIQE